MVLAVWRVTTLVVSDKVLEIPRGLILARLDADNDESVGSWRWYVSYLITCFWCAGWWVSLAWTAAWLRWPGGTAIAALPFAVATAAILINEVVNDGD